jgi:hypothetical protein
MLRSIAEGKRYLRGQRELAAELDWDDDDAIEARTVLAELRAAQAR